MFEKIVLRRSHTGSALTVGEIAEALLFYQNVHVVLDAGTLSSISQGLGMREFLALVRRRRLTAVYTEDMLMERHDNAGVIQQHDFATGMISGRQNAAPRNTRRGRLEIALENSGHSRTDARRLAGHFLELIRIRQYSSDYFIPGGIHRAATADLDDDAYVTEAMRCVLRRQTGFESFAENLSVQIVRVHDKFVIRSNIDFEVANERRKRIDPTLEGFTEGNLAVALLDANADVNVASFYGGDFYTSELGSAIVQVRFAELLRRTNMSGAQLQQFRDIVLRDYPTVREAIDSKERTFGEFEVLLDQSAKFRETVHQMGPDATLVEEYLKEVSREGWISGLPARAMRYVIGLGIGGAAAAVANMAMGAHAASAAAIGTAAGAAAERAWSFADTFLLDRLGAWRPNHFVDGKLKPFLDLDRK